MNQNMGRLIRYFLIIYKLSGLRKYVPGDELISYLNDQMLMRDYEVGISVRTLQRDLREINSMFGINIVNRRGSGYFIADRDENEIVKYEELLMNFDLLNSINHSAEAAGFIIPEHHRPIGSEGIPMIIKAIKEGSVIEFDYKLVRKNNRIISKRVEPYFLKESLGFWYIVALDHDNRNPSIKDARKLLRSYAIDRITNIRILDEEFKKNILIDPNSLFRNSYGIWDDESIPVEEIELSYSPLDGAFLKSKPLHSSQQVIVDNEDEFRIRVTLRITNDFVMALLSRSNSLTVIKPLSLRERIKEIYLRAAERNKT